ncbi:unnamed protein product [Allacma fusca]|uniref:Uncharacterized protein n=1 Tax=Allacma fusca TaxID=39272 RepID=A0A8J2PE82_9HEXA|nr:unnamed protein product [Allacma fusca]
MCTSDFHTLYGGILIDISLGIKSQPHHEKESQLCLLLLSIHFSESILRIRVSPPIMAASTLRQVTITLAFALCALFACVHCAPQLFEDQQEVSDEPLLSDPVDVLETDALPVTRTRRGSQTPIGSYGHHQPTYNQGHGHGHGHGYGHNHGGHGHGHGQGWGWRRGGPVGPVFTYVRTDYHGNFQWGVRHKAGGGWGR